MILGAHDVVPHEDLDNPAYSQGGDDDNRAWGDLPYACDAPYSQDPARFVGPTGYRKATRSVSATRTVIPPILAKNCR